MSDLNCLRCQTPMESGVILDREHGGWREPSWSPGQARSHWWGIENPKTSIPVTTMRCPKCGALESFAQVTPPSQAR